jgi:hypothetical protein
MEIDAVIGDLRSNHFADLVGQACEVVIPSGEALVLEVDEVTENTRAMPRRAAPGRRTPFTVVLKGSAESPLVCGQCTLRATGLEVANVHIDRIAPLDESGQIAWYQIIIN